MIIISYSHETTDELRPFKTNLNVIHTRFTRSLDCILYYDIHATCCPRVNTYAILPQELLKTSVDIGDLLGIHLVMSRVAARGDVKVRMSESVEIISFVFILLGLSGSF